jgi:hypothetical protein
VSGFNDPLDCLSHPLSLGIAQSAWRMALKHPMFPVSQS